MKNIIVGIIAAVVFLSLGYVLVFRSGAVLAGKKIETISSEELKQRLGSKDVPVLLDVREKKELEDDLGHIPGIIHIPIGSLKSRLSELEAEKDKEVVTICRAGVRAKKAAKILIKDGFKHVKVLEGGMMSYRKAEGH